MIFSVISMEGFGVLFWYISNSSVMESFRSQQNHPSPGSCLILLDALVRCCFPFQIVSPSHSVDGINPALVDMVNILLFSEFLMEKGVMVIV